MSLKSVEMQISIPRTNDAGMVQNQLSHKPMHDQAALAAGTVQQSQQQRQKTAKVEETVPLRVKDEPSNQRRQQQRNNYPGGKSAGKKSEHDSTQHPFKGRNIDYSL